MFVPIVVSGVLAVLLVVVICSVTFAVSSQKCNYTEGVVTSKGYSDGLYYINVHIESLYTTKNFIINRRSHEKYSVGTTLKCSFVSGSPRSQKNSLKIIGEVF